MLARTWVYRAGKVVDLVTMIACYAIAAVLLSPERARLSLETLFAMRIRLVNVAVLAVLAVVWHVVLLGSGVYRSQRLTTTRAEVWTVLRATTIGSALVFVISSMFRVTILGRGFLPSFLVLVSFATIATRLLRRQVLGAVRRHGRNRRNALFIGTNPRAVAFAQKLEAKAELGYHVVGFLDDRSWDAGDRFERSGYELLAGVEELPAVLRRRVVDDVFVFLPMKSFYELGSRIVSQCEEQGIQVTFPRSLFPLTNGRLVAGQVDSDSVLMVATGSIFGAGAIVKRTLDVAIASFLLILLAPLLAVVALLVRLDSPGPALFSQERVGLNKRRFRMLKFRTMVLDAEERMKELEHLNEASGPVFKIRKDPRITRVGAFLRRTSIDELPQLWNVLKGDLSLVGPRPLPVRDYEGFSVDWHRRRFSVRPGITCLWQIGGRSDVSFERWMELDLQYIDRWSLWLDVRILVKTLPVVFRGTGAA